VIAKSDPIAGREGENVALQTSNKDLLKKLLKKLANM
jgi:hypothetical protein